MTIVPPYLIEALERHPSRRVRRAAERTRATVVRDERLPVAPAERIARRPHPRRRLVYDSERTRALPGTLVRSEGERRCGDEDADRAYDMAGQTLEFYAAVFERDSIDDRGMHVVSSVHFGERYQNASWDGRSDVLWRR
jgi:Zn-dependent metalloprotease